MIEERSAWRSRFGFYIASIGTAFGLGNLWRFPYVSMEYGGGAFVFLYILMAFFIGIPLMISEISLGKFLYKKGITLSDLVEKGDSKLNFLIKPLLWLPYLISFVVLSYYCVLSGWTLHLLARTVSSLYEGAPFFDEKVFLQLKMNPLLQAMLSSVHLIVVSFIATKGLKAGIEKWLSFVMPFFVCFLFYISFKILNETDLFESIRYMVYPNFHLLTAKSFSYALGHVLFTMSLGFGAVVTLGSYLPKFSSSGTAGVRVAAIDTMVSICIGIVIFPVVAISNYDGALSEALFRAVPNFIQIEGLSLFLALGFYICIFIASINASIGLVETIMSKVNEQTGWDRGRASRMLYVCVMLVSIFIIYFNKIGVGVIFGRSFLEQIDDVVINHILPISAIVISLVTLRFVEKGFLKAEFDVDEKIENLRIYKLWRFFLWFIMPLIYLVSLVLRYF